ncbi:hypothetical protein LIS04_195 [Listeria phage LIS04]|nr:hypothetical protein LIS04_195 [Listeria phage LIS04]
MQKFYSQLRVTYKITRLIQVIAPVLAGLILYFTYPNNGSRFLYCILASLLIVGFGVGSVFFGSVASEARRHMRIIKHRFPKQ